MDPVKDFVEKLNLDAYFGRSIDALNDIQGSVSVLSSILSSLQSKVKHILSEDD